MPGPQQSIRQMEANVRFSNVCDLLSQAIRAHRIESNPETREALELAHFAFRKAARDYGKAEDWRPSRLEDARESAMLEDMAFQIACEVVRVTSAAYQAQQTPEARSALLDAVRVLHASLDHRPHDCYYIPPGR